MHESYYIIDTFRCWTNHVQVGESGREGHAAEIDTAAQADRPTVGKQTSGVIMMAMLLLEWLLQVVVMLDCGGREVERWWKRS